MPEARMHPRRSVAQPGGRLIHLHDLAVTCHCEATIVRVPRTDILNGRTTTCGHPHCTPALPEPEAS